MCGELSQGGTILRPEDEITQEVDIEDDRDCRYDIQEEEEREEVALYEDRRHNDFDSEHTHNDQTHIIEGRVLIGSEQGRPEIIEE